MRQESANARGSWQRRALHAHTPAARQQRVPSPRGAGGTSREPPEPHQPPTAGTHHPRLPPLAPRRGTGSLAGGGHPHSSWCLEGPLLPKRRSSGGEQGGRPAGPGTEQRWNKPALTGLSPQGPAGVLSRPRNRMDSRLGAPVERTASPPPGSFLEEPRGPRHFPVSWAQYPQTKHRPASSRDSHQGRDGARRSPRLAADSVFHGAPKQVRLVVLKDPLTGRLSSGLAAKRATLGPQSSQEAAFPKHNSWSESPPCFSPKI